MPTDAQIGHGALIAKLTAENPDVWTAFGEVTNIVPPNLSRDSIDASHSQSPEAWREFIPGMKDGGEVSFDFNLIPGSPTLNTVLAEFDSSTVNTYRIQFPSGHTYRFRGFLTGHEPETPLDDKMTASVTIKVSGKPGPLAIP